MIDDLLIVRYEICVSVMLFIIAAILIDTWILLPIREKRELRNLIKKWDNVDNPLDTTPPTD